MAINLSVGQKIPLEMLIDERPTDKFVRAIIRDAAGSEITGSPIDVPHLASGYHFDDTLLMPNTDHVSIEYDVFTDSGFTTAADFKSVHERMDKDELGSAVSDLVNASRKADLDGVITDDDAISMAVSDNDEIKLTVGDED